MAVSEPASATVAVSESEAETVSVPESETVSAAVPASSSPPGVSATSTLASPTVAAPALLPLLPRPAAIKASETSARI